VDRALKTLYLIRHADARGKASGEADFDRSLTDRGEKDAAWIGQRLKERDVHVDLIYSSSAVRARESARLVARELGLKASQVTIDKALYLAGVPDLLDIVLALDNSASEVVVVGHNPGIIQFANWLTSAGVNQVPTCGTLRIDFPIDSWREVKEGVGSLIFFDHPTHPF
jgi:phosphohistidine phosphatase